MLEKEKTNIKTILMYVVGIFLIISMATYLGRNLLVAILMGLLGIAILPPVNEKINERWIKGNKNKNTAKVILEVALFFLIVALVPRTVETSSEQIAKGENLIVNNVEENTQNTINNTVNITNTTNTQDEEQVSNVSVENTIKETAQPKQEEPKSSTPSSYSSTASSSSKASTSTSTSSSTQSKSTKQTTSSSTTKQSSSGSSTSSSSTQNSQTVYVTPTGKRYHLSPTCGGKNSTATTLSNAKSMGLTPCKKCAQ